MAFSHSENKFLSLYLYLDIVCILSLIKSLQDRLFQFPSELSSKLILLNLHGGDRVYNTNGCKNKHLIIFLTHDPVINKQVGPEFILSQVTTCLLFQIPRYFLQGLVPELPVLRVKFPTDHPTVKLGQYIGICLVRRGHLLGLLREGLLQSTSLYGLELVLGLLLHG